MVWTRLVRIALKADGVMHKHHADVPITVHCLKGKIRFEVGGRSHELNPCHLLVVVAGLPHSARALEESAFLLTIGGLHGTHAS